MYFCVCGVIVLCNFVLLVVVFLVFVFLYFLHFGHKSSRGFPVKLLNLPADYDLWSVGVINCTGHATECATPNITLCSSSIKMDTGVKNAIKKNTVVEMLQKYTGVEMLQKGIQGWTFYKNGYRGEYAIKRNTGVKNALKRNTLLIVYKKGWKFCKMDHILMLWCVYLHSSFTEIFKKS